MNLKKREETMEDNQELDQISEDRHFWYLFRRFYAFALLSEVYQITGEYPNKTKIEEMAEEDAGLCLSKVVKAETLAKTIGEEHRS